MRMGHNRALTGLGMAVVMTLSTPVNARDSLGVYEGWAAFRDAQPHRCYAIAAPDKSKHGRSLGGRWKPFASISDWPDAGVRGQIHLRLSNAVTGKGAPLVLKIDGQPFPIVAGGADAWAPNATTDAAIVAAMRSGQVMSLGIDIYTLKGAATAIDAAALGCARRR